MARLTNNQNRINTVMPKLVVYRLTREELSNNVVSLSGPGASSTNAATLRFTLNGSGSSLWNEFKEWWKKNNNLIILGCMVRNYSTVNNNSGFYWCPAYRTPNITRTDTYTNYLDFICTRQDNDIFLNTNVTVYEFYFINLTH